MVDLVRLFIPKERPLIFAVWILSSVLLSFTLLCFVVLKALAFMRLLFMPIVVKNLFFSLAKNSVMSETQFDSEVISLVQDLGLVLKGSPEHLYFLDLVAKSQYARYHFCDRIKDKAARMERERNIRLSMLYRECRPYSHVKPHEDSFVCAPTLFK